MSRRVSSEEYRRKRTQRCEAYLRAGGTLDAARALAKRDGFGAATSAWITALGKILSKETPR